MKMLNTVNPSRFSHNIEERFAAFILNPSTTVKAMCNRIKMFRQLAQVMHNGDTYIFESIKGLNPSTLSWYSDLLASDYNCNYIELVSRGGDVIRNNDGVIIGKTSCNVYRFRGVPELIDKVLDDVCEIMIKKFSNL